MVGAYLYFMSPASDPLYPNQYILTPVSAPSMRFHLALPSTLNNALPLYEQEMSDKTGNEWQT